MNEIIVRLLPMPVGVRAFTLPDSEGDYNVYLNCRLSAEQQRRSLRHEKMHILRNDFCREASACAIERSLAALL